MSIISVQSHVALGHVGNSAAVFALQRLGFEVWPVHTLQFSNHPGYGDHGGSWTEPYRVAEVLDGLSRREEVTAAAALLTGYLGDPGLVEVIADFVPRLKALSPGALYLCDPVMGDDETGAYVAPALVPAFAKVLLPLADIVTPNRFELEQLAGRSLDDRAQIVGAARELLACGPSLVVVTGLRTRRETIVTLAVSGEGCVRVEAPRVPVPRRPDGAGDLAAALLIGALLDDPDPGRAIARVAAVVHDFIAAAASAGERELPLIREQARLLAPSLALEAHPGP